jgi:hypothetical protein
MGYDVLGPVRMFTRSAVIFMYVAWAKIAKGVTIRTTERITD